jgi:chromosome segregation ATPase
MDRSDVDAKKKQLAAAVDELEQLKRKIAVKEEPRKRIADLRSKIDSIKKEGDAEDLRQMQELAQVSADLHSLRNPDFTKRLFKAGDKLPKLEATFASLTERFEKQAQQIEELQKTDAMNESQLKPIKGEIADMKKTIRELDQFKGRLPAAAPILLQIEDLEDTEAGLGRVVEQEGIDVARLKSKLESLASENVIKIAEHRRITAEAGIAAQDAVQTKGKITAVFNELEALSSQLQVINVAMKAEVDKSQAGRSEIESLRPKVKQEMAKIAETLAKRREEVARLPTQIKVVDDGTVAVLSKKRAIVEQLQKKLADVRHDLISRYADTPIVHDLTQVLEREWVKHQKLFDIFVKKNAIMLRAQEEVERTVTAIREIEWRWPMNGKVREKRGIEEMEFIYGAVLIQNKQIAIDFASLKEELAVREEMNVTLKAALQAINA